MAVKASATITLTSYRDTQSVTRYYKLQPAGSSAPLKPETKPPSSDWTDSEPACDISKELYFCDLTIFSNGEGEYSKVSKSTSYEAAKQAYNKAQAAKDSVDNLEIGGRNLILKSNTAVQSTSYLIKEYTLSEDWNSDLLNNRGYILTLKGSINNGQKFGVWLNGATNNVGYMTYDSEKDLYYLKPYLPTSTPVTENYKRTIRFYNYPSGTATNATIELVKLEKGNKATDWTPAPEDVDAGIANAQETADSIANNIYVPASTLLDGSKISDGSLSINQMDDTVAGTYSDPTTKKGTMEWNDDALHIKSTDANAQNTYETVIGGDGIKFNWNGVETASINQDELRINKTVVINAMEVGNWSWAIHPTTGNLMVKWNGGE